jgi:hypothetical protein
MCYLSGFSINYMLTDFLQCTWMPLTAATQLLSSLDRQLLEQPWLPETGI